MHNLRTRLDRLEASTFTAAPRPVRRFVVQGPHGLSREDAVAFLRGQGHEVRDGDTNIVRIVVGARDGRPVDLPLADRTSQGAR